MAVNLRQTHFRWGKDELAENTHGWYGQEDFNVNFWPGTVVRLLRFTEQETGGTAIADVDAQFQYRRYTSGSWGSWTDITTSSSVVKAVAAAAFADGANCTKRLSGTGTFESSAAGCTEDGTSGGTSNDIAASGNSETECALNIIAADVLDGDILEFRITSPDTTIGYDITPSIVVIKAIHTYTTTFPLTEDPISESSNWICGGTVGLDWYDIHTASGMAMGEDSPEAYSDPCAILTGTWGLNQSVEATVYSNSPSKIYNPEVELRLRNNLSAHVLTGYEILFSVYKDGDSYLGIGRWNGARGDIVGLAGLSGDASYGVADGDVVKATIIGSRISVYINDVLMLTCIDATPITTGNPGLGINYGCDDTYDDFGFKDFTATDNIVSGAIAVGADDVQFFNDGGTWYILTTDPTIWFGGNNNLPDIGAFRFTLDVDIPNGAIIDTAAGKTKVTFYSSDDHAIDEAYLYVTESANAPQLTTIAQRPSWAGSGSTTTYPTTIRGTGSIHWTGTWPETPEIPVVIDVGPLIQHLVDTYGGLVSGAKIVIWIDGPGDINAESEICAYEYGYSQFIPHLQITYTTGGAIDLVPAEGMQTQAADAPALTQVHNLVVAEGVQAQVSDAPALTQIHVLVAQEGVQIQASDSPAVTQTHVLVAQEGVQVEVSDTPTLTQVHVLAANEGAQVEVSDSPALTQAHTLAVDEGAQVQISDAPALTQAHTLVTQEGAEDQVSDSPALTQVHVLVPAEDYQEQFLDTPALTQVHVLAAQEGAQEQISDQATITVGGVDLIAAEGMQVQVSDTPAVTQVHVLMPADGIQPQISDTPALTQVHVLTPAKGFQTQVSDAAILDLSILLATQKGYQAQYSDSPTLTVISAKVGIDSSLWASKKGLHRPLGKKWYRPGVRGQRWYKPSEKFLK